MVENVEILSFDLRYESYRMKQPSAEKALLRSIIECGIRDPLEGVDTKDGRILLNGFKRYRCAKKVGIGIVPYMSLSNDEAMGIINLIRLSNSKSLSILEQAKLIDDLKNIHNLSVMEIAQELERSKSWVSMRIGILNEMSDFMQAKLFNGEFPVYSYMYTLRQFIRMNYAKADDLDEFVRAVSGKNLSVRNIEWLAHGYFKGRDEFRSQIRSGNISWGLDRLKEASPNLAECNDAERGMLSDLEILQKYMQKIIYKSNDTRFKSNSFFAQANLLAGGILCKMNRFSKELGDFYDRSGKEGGNFSPP
jgi:hypothetical protein